MTGNIFRQNWPGRFLTFYLVMMGFYNCHHAPPRKGEEPNVVIFLVDDLGWNDNSVGFADSLSANNRFYHTPNLMKLAAQGIKFTQAYSASPVCSPTRASILTGKNPARSGITNWIPGEESPQPGQTRYNLPVWNVQGLTSADTTLPGLLRARGYLTAHVGKAHFANRGTTGENPLNLGFDINIAGSFIGHPASFYYPYGDSTHSHHVTGLEEYVEDKPYLDDALTRKAVTIMKEAVNARRPFFLHLAHYAVHTPIQADSSRLGRYDRTERSTAMRHYATMVESMDASLGEVIKTLEELGIAENTVLIFLSDNGGLATHAGPPTDNLPLTGGKGTCREGGTRIPFIIRWPGKISPREETQAQIVTDDLLPTLAGICGFEAPPGDGVDLSPLLFNGKQPAERPLVWHWPHYWGDSILRSRHTIIQPFSSIRVGEWKYVYRYEDGQRELFNLKEDPSEQNNLILNHKEKAREISRRLEHYLRTRHAPMLRTWDTGSALDYNILAVP